MTKKNEKKPVRPYQGQRLSALWLCFLMFVFGYLAASWFDVNQLVKWVGDHVSSPPPAEKVVTKTPETVKPVKEQHPKLEFYTLLTNDAGSHTAVQLSSVGDANENGQNNNTQKNPSAVTVPSGPMELALTAPATEPSPKPNPSPFPTQETPGSAKSTPAARPVLPKPVADELKPAPNPIPVTTTDRYKDRYKGRYVIQVASFRSQVEAKRLREKLAQRRYNAYIVPVMQQSTYWYRVMVGPFSSLGQAQQVQSALSYQEHIRGMIRKD